MSDLPSLKALRVFEAAARLGSFSRAAEELNVTQSAVSRQIQVLEEQLAARLFERNGPKLSLTPVGREYEDVVRAGLTTIRRGTARLFRPGPAPGMTISTVPSLVSKWIVPRVGEFEKAHPDISLRLNASFQAVDFSVSTDIDAAIRYGEGRWRGVAAELLVDDVMFPVASPALASKIRTLDDLARQQLLVEDPHWDLWGDWLAVAGLDALPGTRRRLSDDYNVQIEAAILGHGVALTRGLLAADELRAGRLLCPFKIAVRSRVQYYFVCPAERLAEPTVRRTLEWFKTAARDTVAGLEAWYGRRVDPYI